MECNIMCWCEFADRYLYFLPKILAFCDSQSPNCGRCAAMNRLARSQLMLSTKLFPVEDLAGAAGVVAGFAAAGVVYWQRTAVVEILNRKKLITITSTTTYQYHYLPVPLPTSTTTY